MSRRHINALEALVRERLRREDVNEAAEVGFTKGQILGALSKAAARMSRQIPYQDEIIVRRALGADIDYVAADVDASALSATDTVTVTNQPDKPRNITFTYTESSGTITALVITVVGTDKDNDSLTETFTWSSSLTLTGSEKFKTIATITIDTITGNGAGDILDVGIGEDVLGSRELDLSSIAVEESLKNLLDVPYDLMAVRYVEFPLWNEPPKLRGVKKMTSKIIRLDMGYDPDYDANIKLYYDRKHRLNASETTVPTELEDVLIDGACAYALLSLGASFDNAVPLGAQASNKLKLSSQIYMDDFLKGIKANMPMEVVPMYARG